MIPDTSKVTAATPVSSCAVARIGSIAPAITSAGVSSTTVGGAVSGAATTAICAALSAVLPLRSTARASASTKVPGRAPAGTVAVTWNGSTSPAPTSAPSSRNTTRATPRSSATRASNVTASPAAARGGAERATTGSEMSGRLAIVRTAVAVPALPAASRAVAVTRTCWPGEATAGSVSARVKGGAGSSVGSAPARPSTSKRSAVTPTSSVATAVKSTRAPGSAAAGPPSVTRGGVRSGAASITIARVAVSLLPAVSVTVSVTVKVPGWS